MQLHNVMYAKSAECFQKGATRCPFAAIIFCANTCPITVQLDVRIRATKKRIYCLFLYYAGHMMHVMAEFYESEMMVPLGPKAITNLCTSFRRDDTKEGDLIETIAHFKDI